MQEKITQSNQSLLLKIEAQDKAIQDLTKKLTNMATIPHKESIDSSSFINTSSRSLFVNTMKDKDFGPSGNPLRSKSKKSLKPTRSTRNIGEQKSVQENF